MVELVKRDEQWMLQTLQQHKEEAATYMDRTDSSLRTLRDETAGQTTARDVVERMEKDVDTLTENLTRLPVRRPAPEARRRRRRRKPRRRIPAVESWQGEHIRSREAERVWVLGAADAAELRGEALPLQSGALLSPPLPPASTGLLDLGQTSPVQREGWAGCVVPELTERRGWCRYRRCCRTLWRWITPSRRGTCWSSPTARTPTPMRSGYLRSATAILPNLRTRVSSVD